MELKTEVPILDQATQIQEELVLPVTTKQEVQQDQAIILRTVQEAQEVLDFLKDQLQGLPTLKSEAVLPSRNLSTVPDLQVLVRDSRVVLPDQAEVHINLQFAAQDHQVAQ